MPYIPDVYDQWKRHDAEQENSLAGLPHCSYCGEAIQDEQCYEVDEKAFHLDCMEIHFKRHTEDLVK